MMQAPNARHGGLATLEASYSRDYSPGFSLNYGDEERFVQEGLLAVIQLKQYETS